MVAFGEFTFETLLNIQLFGLKICALRQDTFHLHQDYEQDNFHKKSNLSFIGWSFRNWKIAVYFHLAKSWSIPKFDKMYFFYQHSQPLYDVMQKEIENLEFVLGVNFEFIDSL